MHFDFKHTSLLTVYKCGENSCYRKWSSRNSLRKHLLGPNHNFSAWSVKQNTRQRHIEYNNIEIVNECIDQDNTNKSDILSVESSTNNYLSAITPTEFESIIKDRSDVFVAKLYNRHSIPRNHLQNIIDDITNLFASGHISILKETVISHLHILGSDTDTLQKIISMFNSVENSFYHLRNEYQRVAHFKSCGKHIAPIEYCIGKRRVRENTETFIAEKVKDVYGYFIPLRHILTHFFQLPDAFTATINYINSLNESDNVSNFIQCKLWRKKKENFDNNAIVLPIFVYYDDWEVNNPLGSHSNSLGGVYCYIYHVYHLNVYLV